MKKMLFAICFLAIAAVTLSAQEIFDAIRGGNLTKVKELIEKNGELLNARNTNQSTPLHVAVEFNNELIVRYLIEKGADLNAVNRNNWTSLFYAKEKEIARLLIENGADINYGASNNTALIQSIWNKRKDVTEYLLDRGAKIPDTGTPLGLNLLFLELKLGSIRYFEKCLQQGFDPHYEGEAKSNLLHYASEGDSVELIDKLINMGVPVNKTNLFGVTPLHKAALNGCIPIVKILVRKGADKNARTIDGKTPYNLAVEAKKDETAAYLKSIGVDQSPQSFPVLKGEYLGQPKPGKKAVPFALGIISGSYEYHGPLAFTPDGNEIYWSASKRNVGTFIFCSKKMNGKWTIPEKISKGDAPFISPDGKRLYYTTGMSGQETKEEIIYVRDKTDSGWSEPKELPAIINSIQQIHWLASVDRKGNLYFGVRQSGTPRHVIYYSEYSRGEYSEPQIIESSAHSPYIAPDGSYLIVSKPGEGLNIFYKKKDGTWTNGINLTDIIGKRGECAVVTPDGRYLFFGGGLDGKFVPYWVDASFIKELRPKK